MTVMMDTDRRMAFFCTCGLRLDVGMLLPAGTPPIQVGRPMQECYPATVRCASVGIVPRFLFGNRVCAGTRCTK